VDLPLLVGVDNFGVPLSSTLSLFSLLDLDLSLVLPFEVDLVFEFLSSRSFCAFLFLESSSFSCFLGILSAAFFLPNDFIFCFFFVD
jgi:hypothetical protein